MRVNRSQPRALTLPPMCELFCMASPAPVTFHVSLEPFARHGGLEGPHKDGWGVAWYVDGDVRLLKEPYPAAQSACVRLMRENPVESDLVVSHIRRATIGAVSLKNCQPFVRELGGRMHVFAHNGHLDLAGLRERLPLEGFAPVGDTDSEYAFCGLLERLRRLWRAGSVPRLEDRLDVVGTFAAMARALGPANFVYADGDAVFLHGDRRNQGDGLGIRPPGLHLLELATAPTRPAFSNRRALGRRPAQRPHRARRQRAPERAPRLACARSRRTGGPAGRPGAPGDPRLNRAG